MRAINVQLLVIVAIILAVVCSMCATQQTPEEFIAQTASATPKPTNKTATNIEVKKSNATTEEISGPTSATWIAIISSLIVATVVGLMLMLGRKR